MNIQSILDGSKTVCYSRKKMNDGKVNENIEVDEYEANDAQELEKLLHMKFNFIYNRWDISDFLKNRPTKRSTKILKLVNMKRMVLRSSNNYFV